MAHAVRFPHNMLLAAATVMRILLEGSGYSWLFVDRDSSMRLDTSSRYAIKRKSPYLVRACRPEIDPHVVLAERVDMSAVQLVAARSRRLSYGPGLAGNDWLHQTGQEGTLLGSQPSSIAVVVDLDGIEIHVTLPYYSVVSKSIHWKLKS